MHAQSRSRRSAFRRYGLSALTLATAAAMAVTLVPAQATAETAAQPSRVFGEEPEIPTPGPAPLEPGTELYKIAQDANLGLRYSFAVVAADPKNGVYPEGSVEQSLQRGLLTLPADRLDPAVKAAQELIANPDLRGREFGRYARLSPDEYRKVGFSKAFESVVFDERTLASTMQERASVLEGISREMESAAVSHAKQLGVPLIQLPKIKELDFRLEKVTCIDETNPEIGGDDEILMGGLEIGTANDDVYTHKVNQFLVGGEEYFYDGRSYTYASPGKQFADHDLTVGGVWPRTYMSVVMMAEQDGSGFSDALTDAWNSVKAEVQKAVAKALSTVLTPFIGAALAEVVGQVVAFLIVVFIDWILEFFQDDLFEARTAQVTLPSKYAFHYDNANGWTNWRLPTTTMYYSGHGGDYKAKVHWDMKV